MLKSSIKFNEAFEENVRKIYARVTIGDKSFTEADIFTIDFESGSVNGPGYQIGSVFSDLVKIKFDKVIKDLKELDKVIVEIGIEREQVSDDKQPLFNSKVGSMRVGQGKLNKMFYNNPIEYVRLGTFYISEHADINENDKTTTITCMDAILYFEQQYKPTIKFPADIFDISVDIANQIGISFNSRSFSELPNKKINKPNQLTCRQLIGYISQFACGFIKISKYGVLELKSPKNTVRHIDSSNYHQKGLSKNDLKYRIDGILNRDQVTSKEITSGKTSGSQLVIENPFIDQDDLDSLYDLVKNVEYYPFTLQWYGLPSIEAGDWLIVSDIEGKQFRVPNLSYKLHYNGGLKATSSAETTSQSSELKIFESPLNREIIRLNKEINTTKENAITKDSIIEKINTSEETIDGKPLQISGNKVTINNYTKIDDDSISNEAISSLDINKVFGTNLGDNLEISFDDQKIKSFRFPESSIEIEDGELKMNNHADITYYIEKENLISEKNAEGKDALHEINKTDIVSFFSIGSSKEKIGLIQSSDYVISDTFLNDNNEISQTQIIMTLLVAVKDLSQQIDELKRRD